MHRFPFNRSPSISISIDAALCALKVGIAGSAGRHVYRPAVTSMEEAADLSVQRGGAVLDGIHAHLYQSLVGFA